MSSDLFDVRVASLSGDTITLDLLTGTAGGLDDLCASRSFALSLLGHAQRGSGTPLEAALVALGGPWQTSDWYVNEAWMREHAGHFVAQTALVERRNAVGERELRHRDEVTSKAAGGAERTLQRWAQCHNYTLRVSMTDSKWLVGFRVGQAFGTTAFDVWIEHDAAEHDAAETNEALPAIFLAMESALREVLPGAVIDDVQPDESHVVGERCATLVSAGARHAVQLRLQADGTEYFLEARCSVGMGDATRLDAALGTRKVVPGEAFLAQERGHLFACIFVFAPLADAPLARAIRDVLELSMSLDALALID